MGKEKAAVKCFQCVGSSNEPSLSAAFHLPSETCFFLLLRSAQNLFVLFYLADFHPLHIFRVHLFPQP